MGCGGGSSFPTWTLTIGQMLTGNCRVRAICTECSQFHDVDVAALAERVGADFTLIDRRCRCRLTPGCPGWNRFYYLGGVFRPLWTDRASRRWSGW